jgi:hypothetical protein
VALALSASISAHQLDEYLQASRVSLERDGVTLDIDLTPGARVAGRILTLIDADGDGRVSPVEAEAYARAVLEDVIVELDGRAVSLALTRVEVPTPDELREGMGTIQLRAHGDAKLAWFGRTEVRFRNNHEAGLSVYLVNALMPDDADIDVVSQSRDAQQRDARIEYSVTPYWPKYLYWPLVGLVAIVLVFRRSGPAHSLRVS